MRNQRLIIAYLFVPFICLSCKIKDTRRCDLDVWYLSWRIVESYWSKDSYLAASQFDSLIVVIPVEDINNPFLSFGITSKLASKKLDGIHDILHNIDSIKYQELCPILKNYNFESDLCNRSLKADSCCDSKSQFSTDREIAFMFVQDQYVRGNTISEYIREFKIDEEKINKNPIMADAENRNALRKWIAKNGFPSKQNVREDLLEGVFFVIQHSDQDTVWQRSQLENIRIGSQNGDFTKKNYAYLYDRIMVNSGKNQLYGRANASKYC